MGVRVGVDVGGTFTDLVAIGDGRVVTCKVPSTPEDQSAGVEAAIAAARLDPSSVDALAHGTTVATNALLERDGARTALVTTEGFRDVIEIARQNRASLYDLTKHHPPPLVPRDLRFTVRERMGPDGVITPLEEDSVARCVDAVRASEAEAVAVCLLFGYLYPEHERRLRDALRSALPDVRVVASHDVLPEFREYERTATTVADAYLGPKISRYLERLGEVTKSTGLPEPLVMRSSGGVVDLGTAAGNAAAAVLSGPAGGVVGAAFAARAGGYDDVLTFDMGGTSTDVAPVLHGRVETATDAVVAGVPIRFPMVDVHTVSAGGGSIAWVDEGGGLHVGPRSAGADPGPAAYGRGGTDPTVTDANLVLGYLADGALLGGEVTLDRARAEAAMHGLGRGVGLDALAAARGVIEVADQAMTRALRVVSVERGLDPRDLALVAFGGAGPMHACALAGQLGMTTVIVPQASGVLSALGLAVADVRRDYQAPVHELLSEVDPGHLSSLFDALESQAVEVLARPSIECLADVRYRGQAFELSVDASNVAGIEDRFAIQHERLYGYAAAGEPVEIVTVRVVATQAVTKPDMAAPEPSGDARAPRRTAWFGELIDADVWRREALGVGAGVTGPCIVEFAEATCVVAPGWSGAVDGAGNLVLEVSR